MNSVLMCGAKCADGQTPSETRKNASDDCDPINTAGCRHCRGMLVRPRWVKALWVECRGVGPDGGGHQNQKREI